MFFDILDLMVPLLKGQLSLPTSGITTKCIDLGVPNLSPADVSILRRQPTSSSAQGGPAGYCPGSLGPHPIPPWKATSPSSKLALLPPTGTCLIHPYFRKLQ